jgi:hypothetical protein
MCIESAATFVMTLGLPSQRMGQTGTKGLACR